MISPRAVLAASPGESLDAALTSAADALLLPATAREHFGRVATAGKAAFAAVSHARTRRLRDDIAASVSPALKAIVLPVLEPQDVRDAGVALREFELACGMEPGVVAIFPSIGTARALLRAIDIASAAPRVAGLVFNAAAYARDTGARDEETGPRLAYARGQAVAVARAIDGLPLVAGVQLNFAEMARYGFTGAVVASPQQAAAAGVAFAPGEADLARARADIEAYRAARDADEWVAERDGEIIDLHRVRKARRLLGHEG